MQRVSKEVLNLSAKKKRERKNSLGKLLNENRKDDMTDKKSLLVAKLITYIKKQKNLKK